MTTAVEIQRRDADVAITADNQQFLPAIKQPCVPALGCCIREGP